MSLPNWPGADRAYSYLYRVLERLAETNREAQKRNKRKRIQVIPSDEMTEIVDALNKGDEEMVKGIALRYRTREFVNDRALLPSPAIPEPR